MALLSQRNWFVVTLTLSLISFLPLNYGFAKPKTKEEKEAAKQQRKERREAKREEKEKKQEARREAREQRQEERREKRQAAKEEREKERELKKETIATDQGSVHLNALENVEENQEKQDQLIKKEQEELAYYESMKGKECTDPSKPCVWDEVIEASKAELDELKEEAARLDKREENLCKAATDRLNKRHDRWAGIVKELQPLKDEIARKEDLIETLKRTKKDTAKDHKDDFKTAIENNEKELREMKKNFRKKYAELAGPSKAYVPGFNRAKLKLARTENKMARVAAQCPQSQGVPDESSGGTNGSRSPASDPTGTM